MNKRLNVGSHKRGAYYINRPHVVFLGKSLMLDGIVPPLLVVLSAIVLSWVRRRVVGDQGGRRADLAVALGIIGVSALLELAMGRSPAYARGPVALWVGDVNSDQNSQQLSDPYTFSHVIHGALFYAITHVAMRPASFAARAVVAPKTNIRADCRNS